ncbi:high mobility group B protein 6-like isoform X2 [Lycium ferocissimum]|uniref:high mobility group B protein 6-like isoform X2 n=1 Tax=Lycium ferocissimum TaxID=112874 RepID=UPI0028155F35|nr:high mobility group B protein 6-like isoform X2 [Lycium ferocissimum]
MEMNLDKHPSCMLLFKEGSTDKIQMPSDFVKEHKKMLAKTCLLKTDVVAGMSWEAKIEKEKPNYFICKEDWPQFVVYHKLEIGDFLRFVLIDKSTFHVLLYSKKHSRTLRPFEDLSSSEEEEEEYEKEDEVEIVEENVDASRKSNPFSGSNDRGNPCYSHLDSFCHGGKSDAKADNMLGMKKKAPETKKANEVKMEPVILLDSEEERVGQSSGSKDGGNPCYSHIVGKSDAKDNMLGVKKKAPETKEVKKVFMELVELSDSEEENVDPSRGSKDGGNPCYSHPGGKPDAKADNMLGVEKKAPETKGTKNAAKRRSASYVKRWRSIKDPAKPKRPATSFFVFMEEFRKQFKEKYPNNKSVAAEGIAGGDKWKQFSDAEKAPFVAEAKKRLAEYHKNKDAYNKRVAAGSSEEEESYKSMSEVDEEDGDDD